MPFGSGIGLKGLGIDLGTVNTLICDQNSQILLNEPSVVTINRRTNTIEAVGQAARRMLGRTPGDLEVIMPLRDGVINHFDLTREMLRLFLRRVRSGPHWQGTRLVICVPSETTQIERRAVRETGMAMKASEVHVLEEPMAAACGAGLKVDEPRGSMIVDLGGGTTEIALISFFGIVVSGSVRIGGVHLDEAIVQHIRRKYNLLIGQDTAERLKIGLGETGDGSGGEVVQVKGRDLISQLPKTRAVARSDVMEAIRDLLETIIRAIKATLEKAPPELAADLTQDGIVLTGGGALLPGLGPRIQKETGTQVRVAENALLSVALGASRLLREPHILERVHLRDV